jgi:hypothetical protein
MMAINSWLAGGKQQRRLERSAAEVNTFDGQVNFGYHS